MTNKQSLELQLEYEKMKEKEKELEVMKREAEKTLVNLIISLEQCQKKKQEIKDQIPFKNN